jgi:hypothetical protein
MRTIKKLRAVALAALAVSAVALAATAASASAFVPASWVGVSKSGAWSYYAGELTLTLNEANPKTCKLAPKVLLANEGTTGDLTTFGEWKATSCSTGKLNGSSISGEARFGTAYELIMELDSVFSLHESPYGNYVGKTFIVPFTNAAGSTASHITFNKTAIGEAQSGGTIRATGTLTVTNSEKPGGTSYTLTH